MDIVKEAQQLFKKVFRKGPVFTQEDMQEELRAIYIKGAVDALERCKQDMKRRHFEMDRQDQDVMQLSIEIIEIAQSQALSVE